MKQYGDITKLSGYELDPVDLIVGGSPCQDLSVAGKRAGLDGERSGLFMEMIRIIKEMRSKTNGIYPRFALWENVPGAFSSNKGADFSAVLGEFARIAEPDAPDVPIPQEGWSKSGVLLGSDWTLAWRTHDAQFWGKTIMDSRTGNVLALGTPQRRRRIALVVDLRRQSAPEILFERKSLSGNPEQSGTAGQGSAGTAADSIGETGKCLNPWDIQMKRIQPADGVADSLCSAEKRYGGGESLVMVLNGQGGQQMDVSDKAMTLRSESHGHEPIVMNPRPMSMVTQTDKAATLGADDYKEPQIVLSFQERSGKPGGGKGILIQEDHVGALSTLNNQAVLDDKNGKNSCYGIDQQGGKGGANYTVDVSPTLASDSHGTPHAVCYSIGSNNSDDKTYCLQGGGVTSQNSQGSGINEDVAFTLNATDRHAVCYNGVAITSKLNATNPQPGDPCHTLSQDSRNYVVCDPSVHHGYKEFDDVSETIRSRYGTGGNNQPLVVATMQGFGDYIESDTASSCKQRDYKDATDLVCRVDDPQVFGHSSFGNYAEGTGSPKASGGDLGGGSENLVIGALCADDHKGANRQYVADGKCQITNNLVRRLTPLECERLQGYPDGWTDIPGASDSAKYKALGNSICLPAWEFLAWRFVEMGGVKTIGSLFDGIAGFPLVFKRAGAKTLWTSEIEPFCQKVVEWHVANGDL